MACGYSSQTLQAYNASIGWEADGKVDARLRRTRVAAALSGRRFSTVRRHTGDMVLDARGARAPRYTQSPSRTGTVVQSWARVEGLGLQSQPAGWDCGGTGIVVILLSRDRPAPRTAVRASLTDRHCGAH